jgi:hypothetical protein
MAASRAALEAEPNGRCQERTPSEARAEAVTGSSGRRLREAQLGPDVARCRGAPVGCTRVLWAVVHPPRFQVGLGSIVGLAERMHLSAQHLAAADHKAGMGSTGRQSESYSC